MPNKTYNKPPNQEKKDSQENSDSNDEEEESKDHFDINPIKDDVYQIKPPTSSAQPIKANHNLNVAPSQQPQKPHKKIHDYTPSKWNDYFDEMEYMDNGTPLYYAGTGNSPIFVCLHGAGHSAMSFALVAKQIKQFSMCVGFDFRSHGESKIKDYKMSAQQLIDDTIEVVAYLTKKFQNPTIVLVGHSMGGSIAIKTTEQLLKTDYADKIQGLIVIDVVEGSAIEALPFMENIVCQRPKGFKTNEQAIQWSLNTGLLKTVESAKISMPPQFTEVLDESGNLSKLIWKVDLMKTETFWMGWFKGLTQSFLNIRIPKILMVAEKERLDTELTVAQMQGKFKLVVLYNTGHSIQEDDPINTAQNMHDFLTQFRVPTTIDELAYMQKYGIGKFHPDVKSFIKVT